MKVKLEDYQELNKWIFKDYQDAVRQYNLNQNRIMNITQEQPKEKSEHEDTLTSAMIEFNKCKENPYYFCTKYLTINGKKFTTTLSESDFNNIHGFNIKL